MVPSKVVHSHDPITHGPIADWLAKSADLCKEDRLIRQHLLHCQKKVKFTPPPSNAGLWIGNLPQIYMRIFSVISVSAAEWALNSISISVRLFCHRLIKHNRRKWQKFFLFLIYLQQKNGHHNRTNPKFYYQVYSLEQLDLTTKTRLKFTRHFALEN